MGYVCQFLRSFLLALVGLAVAVTAVLAQQPLPRVATEVNDALRAPLPAATVPRGAIDLGAVSASESTGRMLLLLSRSTSQQTELDDFLEAAHTPGSSSFHRWLTPAEFGRRFGPAASDLATLQAWLESHGLTVSRTVSGRSALEFTGTASQLRSAFGVSLRRYSVRGQTRMVAAATPTIPAALSSLVIGLVPLGGTHPRPLLSVLGSAGMHPKTYAATPNWSYPTSSKTSYLVTPGDLVIQYDLTSVYKSGYTGSGQTIAIVAGSNVDLSLVQAYRTLFSLSSNLPQVVVDGNDPGITDDATEAYLDLELAGAIAPAARVVLYTSAGTALIDGLALAALRAVEDDLASVISLSYGACELELGTTGNAFWSALWQQAAAQGQTVFVASGDSGSAGCDDFSSEDEANSGLAVNGLASTPYNVAVGGTDFYYSAAAGTSSQVSTQLATYWTSATTSPKVSLRQRAPEQAWNHFFGLNLTDGAAPVNNSSDSILASGGGKSSKARLVSSVKTGWAKPSWQSGTGVPSDGVRDVPDVSLFASTGANYSYIPICAAAGDCSSSNLNSKGAVQVTGVGGTSSAAPVMAAIQALVNQSAGSWSGQAATIYYKLAAKQASVFHDITTGGNQVLCTAGSSGCVYNSTKTSILYGYWVTSGYATTTGYDLATGLGSVDAANLIKYWSSISLTGTKTTLAVSPSTMVHGKSATVTATVARTTGSGTPSGTVSLVAPAGIAHSTGIGAYSLTSGALYTSIDNLPGGSYSLTARYSGDASFAPSTSSAVTITVTAEPTTLSSTAWATDPWDLNLYSISSGMSVPYGSQLYFDVQPLSTNASISSQLNAASGTVAFTDKSGTVTQTSTQTLNSYGLAEWSSGVFAPGSHTVTAVYSGNSSYKTSSATAAKFTILRGTATLTVKPLVTKIASGSSASIDVQLKTGYLPLWGKLPTGTITVALGSSSAAVTLKAFGTAGNQTLEGVAVFAKVPAGLLPVSATYAGDTNWAPASASGGNLQAVSTKLTPAVALVTSSAAPALGKTFTLTATAKGSGATPTGSVLFLADSGSIATTVALSSGKATLTLAASALPNGVSNFTATYLGNSTYTGSASSAVAVSVTKSDFSLTALTPALRLAPGGSGSASLSLTALNSFSGTVTLSASAATGITAKLAASSLALSSTSTTTLTLTVASTVTAGSYPVTVTASSGGHIHSAQVLLAVHK